MKALTFLRAVLPPLTHPGYRYWIAWRRTGEPHSKWQQDSFKTIEEAADKAAHLDETGFDVYYCLSVINGPARIQANCESVRELPLDIDVCKNENTYDSIDEAVSALHTFCKLLEIPLPYILFTGGGIHAHWVLHSSITREVHKTLTTGLKAAAATHNLKIDPATVGSCVQVMRIAGTHNYKRDMPVLVEPLMDSVLNHIPLSDLKPLLELGQEKQLAHKERLIQLQNIPGNAEQMSELCAVAKSFREDGGTKLSYEAWRGILVNISLCTNGDVFAHEWGGQYPGYNYEQTQHKLDDAAEFLGDGGGPMRCDTFRQHCPSLCKSCPYKVGSPIVLARAHREELEAAPADITAQTADGNTVYNNWTILNGRLELVCTVPTENKTENHLIIKTHKYQFSVKQQQWLDRKEMDKVLHTETDLTIVDFKHWQEFARYEQARIKGKIRGYMADALGWRDNFSVLKYGSFEITAQGISPIYVSNNISQIVSGMKPGGASTKLDWYLHEDWIKEKVEGQIRAYQPFFRRGFEHQAVLILGGGLAPLFWELIEPTQGGIIFAPYGEASGTGKTTAMQAALGLHAPPEVLTLANTGSTVNHMEILGAFRNFPLGTDEAYQRDLDRLAYYIHSFTIGEGKRRLNNLGEHDGRPVAKWHSGLIWAANKSPLAMITSRPDVQAMGERIIEIRFTALNVQPDHKLVRTMSNNWGALTPYFVTTLLRDGRIPELKKRTEDVIEKLWQSNDFTHPQRYKVACLALTTVLSQMLVEYRIFDIDVSELMRHFKSYITESAASLFNNSPIHATKVYIQKNWPNTWLSPTGAQGIDRKVTQRFDPVKGTVIMQFLEYSAEMMKQGFNMKEVLSDLYAAGRITSPTPQLNHIAEAAGFNMRIDCIEFTLDPEELKLFRAQ